MFSLPPQTPPPYVSIQLAVQIEIIARKFSMHFQCVPLIFTLAPNPNISLTLTLKLTPTVAGVASACFIWT